LSGKHANSQATDCPAWEHWVRSGYGPFFGKVAGSDCGERDVS